ncbi:MAG: DUF4124 domain-containing protein [Wenzhouxiangellaceae bacterium]
MSHHGNNDTRSPYRVDHRVVRLLLCSVLLLLLQAAALAQSQIYKSVDEDGNVIYSDQPPSPDAEPIVLRESNIIETVKAQPDPISSGETATQPLEIGILSPQNEETFWGTGNDLPVLLEVKPQLRPGMQINLYLDDEKVATVGTLQTTLQQIDRGTHSFRAELVSSEGEIIASTESRTFFMKQFSQNFNNNR